ncbi:MAG: hypothetical protein AAF430_22720 [Myxococcota bacterium]
MRRTTALLTAWILGSVFVSTTTSATTFTYIASGTTSPTLGVETFGLSRTFTLTFDLDTDAMRDGGDPHSIYPEGVQNFHLRFGHGRFVFAPTAVFNAVINRSSHAWSIPIDLTSPQITTNLPLTGRNLITLQPLFLERISFSASDREEGFYLEVPPEIAATDPFLYDSVNMSIRWSTPVSPNGGSTLRLSLDTFDVLPEPDGFGALTAGAAGLVALARRRRGRGGVPK